MNGEDLRFLAERASGLDDRTAVRVEEVHDRIATARRRRTVTALAGAACLVVALVVGIQLVTGTSNRAGPDPAPTPAPIQGATMPEPGTCWNVPPRAMVGKHYAWFDDSAQVSCTAPHTSETAQAIEVDVPTVAEARKEGGDLCWDYVRNYLSVEPTSWVPWGWVTFLPSKEAIADGASWIRCDAVFTASWNGEDVRTITVPVESAADDPPAVLWACLDKPPTAEVQPFVPCDRPHAYEETGTFAFFDSVQEYPSPAELRSAERLQCAREVPARLHGASVTAYWDPGSSFKPGGFVGGACFVYYADGSPLPPR